MWAVETENASALVQVNNATNLAVNRRKAAGLVVCGIKKLVPVISMKEE